MRVICVRMQSCTRVHAYIIVDIIERYSKSGPFHAAQSIVYVLCSNNSFRQTHAPGLAFLCTFDVTHHCAGPHTTDCRVWHEVEAAHVQRLPYALLLPHSTRLHPLVVVPGVRV